VEAASSPRTRLVVLAEALGQDGGDVLVGADLDLDRAAEHDLGSAHGCLVGRVGEHQPAASAGALIGEDQCLAQEAAGELGRQGCAAISCGSAIRGRR
jgi:hypothetical protein